MTRKGNLGKSNYNINVLQIKSITSKQSLIHCKMVNAILEQKDTTNHDELLQYNRFTKKIMRCLLFIS